MYVKKKKETQQNHKGIPVIFSLFKFKYAIAVSVEIAYYNLSSALRWCESNNLYLDERN